MSKLGIGISGVHRCGKTTLMRELAAALNLTPVETRVGDVFKDMGLKADKQYDFGTRMAAQEEILKRLRALLTEARTCTAASDGFITDRTPIDLIGYTLAEVGPDTCISDGESVRVLQYVRDCVTTTNEFFSTLVYLQPGIAVKREELKGSNCAAYVEHFNSLLLGTSFYNSLKVQKMIVPRTMTDLGQRVRHLADAISANAEAFSCKTLKESVIH